ncbi:hypothetical protein PIB30_044626 [Stylosanthes scabra]|uniref:Uncharacterized protein n=1 Tax=Stylosanthes scabra TaxID=79078 RepID=A0ABU6UGF7_9FABA|nr:hypothetical protein [Stylosanthes scabra]
MEEVEQELFIQKPEDRPSVSTMEAQGIPVIDLSPVTTSSNPSPSSIEALVKEIGIACKKWGFFQVTNHGVPLSVKQNLEEASKEFFGQSLEEKKKVSRDERSPSGYYDTELTRNVRDWKQVFDFLAKEPTLFPLTADEDDDRVTMLSNKSPHHPPHIRDIIQDYIEEMEKLGFKLLELIAMSLGLQPKRLEEFFMRGQTSLIRLNYYPPCPFPHIALGVGPHKDESALTILAQDEVWSNDMYESVEHRAVVNSEKERLSIPYFLFPAHDTEVKPLEELINDQNPSKYRPYKSGKFLLSRMNSNFKKQNQENLQIHYYKLP